MSHSAAYHHLRTVLTAEEDHLALRALWSAYLGRHEAGYWPAEADRLIEWALEMGWRPEPLPEPPLPELDAHDGDTATWRLALDLSLSAVPFSRGADFDAFDALCDRASQMGMGQESAFLDACGSYD